jgi:hypothetical protein
MAGRTSGKVTLIDPGTNRVRGVLLLHGRLSGIAVGEGSVWVTNTTDQSVVQIGLKGAAIRPTRGSAAIPFVLSG